MQYHPHGTVGHWGTGLCPNMNNLTDRNTITEKWWLKSLGSSHFFTFASLWPVMTRCLQCACANGVLYPTASWLGSEVVVGRQLELMEWLEGAVCLAGLVGVIGGNFGELVLLVGVGWLVLQLWFKIGLFLLSGS